MDNVRILKELIAETEAVSDAWIEALSRAHEVKMLKEAAAA